MSTGGTVGLSPIHHDGVPQILDWITHLLLDDVGPHVLVLPDRGQAEGRGAEGHREGRGLDEAAPADRGKVCGRFLDQRSRKVLKKRIKFEGFEI
jgi:hypothetical protein